MHRTINQRRVIRFFIKLYKFITETFITIREGYKDEAMFRTRVYKWYKKFKVVREGVETLS